MMFYEVHGRLCISTSCYIIQDDNSVTCLEEVISHDMRFSTSDTLFEFMFYAFFVVDVAF